MNVPGLTVHPEEISKKKFAMIYWYLPSSRKTLIKKSQNLNDRILGWWYVSKSKAMFQLVPSRGCSQLLLNETTVNLNTARLNNAVVNRAWLFFQFNQKDILKKWYCHIRLVSLALALENHGRAKRFAPQKSRVGDKSEKRVALT